ncbi:chromosomal replication initiator protein DnaA [Clostridium aminobutyricum]|uniref:Chromosomal replication initiator protein DnaA n=1 Tax=Clostridium aminobutyricum TaxID=33953 RepID=A0A939D8B0_CLOAM|nr:chromosomal replication initiator protein DnaA [Clostridium aminobutyricum]MBN7773334.1 chromosomal replication initiator protein DnaA [Clostridium aminobutyricum]
MNDINEKWEKALALLFPEMTEVSYNTWLVPIIPIRTDERNNKLYLNPCSDMNYNILTSRYLTLITNAVEVAFGKKYEVILELNESTEEKQEDEYDAMKKRFPDEYYLNPRYNFNTFVVGNNNRYAHAASVAVAEAPAEAYNPLFLYGASGLGKTHLMHAIGQYILRNHPHLKVLYVSSEMFTNELIKALGEKKNTEFRNKYRKIDVLLIDDIQFIEGKEATQEEFFHTFNTLYDANKQIIISSDRPPAMLTKIEERLRSRFQWNIIADIQPPDYETRVAILMKKAVLENINMDDNLEEVIHLIAEKIKMNIRELEGAFTRVIAYSSLINKEINVAFAKDVLKDIMSNTEVEVTPELIKKQVCKHFNIKTTEIESAKRTRALAFPRQIAMYLCRDMTDLSLPKVGEYFGGRDHTTVMHACEKISSEIKMNESIREVIETLQREINEKR